MEGVQISEDALATQLFQHLTRAVRAIGRERLKRNYKTTFWLALDASPTNVAEEAALALLELVKPGPRCIGIEWWLGRLRHGQKLRMHFDRDMTLRKQTGQYVHPMFASALFLNEFRSSPMIVSDQIPSPDGKSRIPRKSLRRQVVEPRPNRYAVFSGNLRHGVIPDQPADRQPPAKDTTDSSQELRLSLLVNYWDRRPLPPLCFDYDGSIYPALRTTA